jgi:ATP-dependent helicase/DNAse subunit B
MDISFLRSSSIGTWSGYCQHKYYMVYVLGMEDPSNIKTEVGTVVHAVLEILAGMKKSYQETKKYEFEHAAGLFKCKPTLFMKPYSLTDNEIDVINKSRKNKETYKDQIEVEYGHKRYGVENVENILEKVFKYYSEKSRHDWGNIEYRNCLNFTWMTLDWNNGQFDPRKRSIIYPEYPFNIEIKKPWAKLPNGEYLRIKGTIDLVTELDKGIVEICDWKTGARYDWGKGKEKTYEDLMQDPQLMLYYYAARKSMPEYEAIMLTIFFMRDGGPFTLAFDDSILEKVENNLRKNFEEIRDCKKPKLRDSTHKDFQCNKLCGFFKQKIEDSCVCDYISNEIKLYGIEKASEKNRKVGFSVDKYNSPGE